MAAIMSGFKYGGRVIVPGLFEFTAFNSANTKLVTLAPGLRPERRFAPLARGLRYHVLRINLHFPSLIPPV